MGVRTAGPRSPAYAEVNQLFGDIVKVTPSSKVVGDMALFLFSRGIHPADVSTSPRRRRSPRASSMLTGAWLAGWPDDVSRVVLGERRHAEARAKYDAAVAAPDAIPGWPGSLETLRADVAKALGHEPSDDALYSHLMYPQVHTTFVKHRQEFGDVSVLPTPAFFYGLQPGEEIQVEIEPGKMLIILAVAGARMPMAAVPCATS
jgi:pyruvate carboxylase